MTTTEPAAAVQPQAPAPGRPRVVTAPRAAAGRTRRMLAPVATIGTLAAATLALHVRDPHRSHSWGVCPLYAATGIWCPGCGGLRAVNDLTHGQVGAALSSNLVLTLLLPLGVAWLAAWAVDGYRGVQRVYPRRVVLPAAVLLGVVLVVFTVLRNLAVGAWLAP